MFEGNPYKLLENKFDYFRQVFQNLGVEIVIEEVADNPYIDLSVSQNDDDKRAEKTGGKSRKITLDSYTHWETIVKRGGLIRGILWSSLKEYHDDNGELIIDHSPHYSEVHLPSRAIGLYNVTGCLFWSLLSRPNSQVVRHIIDDNFYLWAEQFGITDRLNEERFERSFEYYKYVAQSFIDVLGEDVVIDLVDSFFVCAACGEGTDR